MIVFAEKFNYVEHRARDSQNTDHTVIRRENVSEIGEIYLEHGQMSWNISLVDESFPD